MTLNLNKKYLDWKFIVSVLVATAGIIALGFCIGLGPFILFLACAGVFAAALAFCFALAYIFVVVISASIDDEH